jgi:hypothetical protein
LSLRIAHTHTDGTVVEGDPRPHHKILKDAGFRWSPNIGWYVPRSRFAEADRVAIDKVAEALGKHFEVTVDVEDGPVDPAEREAFLAENAMARAERLADRAARLKAQADTALEKARGMRDVIPMGQPILEGHHSEKRDRNFRAKINRVEDKAVEKFGQAKEAERKAEAAVSHQEHREDLGTTLRRIDRLETEQRDIQRKLATCTTSGRPMKAEAKGITITCPECQQDQTVGDDAAFPVHGGATGEWATKLTARSAEIDGELTYWKDHVEGLEASGSKIWGPDDFQIGDRVNDGCTIVRVNKKSLTVQHDVFPSGHHNTLPFNKVRSVEKQGADVA